MPKRFRPPLWSIPLVLTLTAIFLSAGGWQLRKGLHKQALEAAMASAPAGPTLDLAATTPAPKDATVTRVRAVGHYDPDHQLLLDNQTREQVPGYRVWTPFALDAGGVALVDRGWVAADPHREKLPAVDVGAGPRTVTGLWRPIPKAGLKLGKNPCDGTFPRVVNYPDDAEIACMIGNPAADGLLLLDASTPDGFVREWQMPDPLPPSRHFGYAAQWFAFAATLLFLFVRYSFKVVPA